MNNLRPGKVAEATAIGVVLLLAALVGGQWVSQHPTLGAGVHLVGDVSWRGR